MAGYYKNNRTLEVVISGVVGYGIIGIAIYKYFNWPSVVLAILGVLAFLFFLDKYQKYKNNKQELTRATAPCKHGMPGALHGYSLCSQCQQEKEAAAEIARKQKIEDDTRRQAEKERAYKEWVRQIRLPDYLRKMYPAEFEKLVCDLFRQMGYEVEPTPYSGDNGIDGFLKKGSESSVLQCKRVKGSVGEPILRDLYGTMHATGASEGVVVTTGRVSAKARIWAGNKPIRIIELTELVALIRAHYPEDQVVPERFAPISKLEDLCPKCGSPLRIVTWKGSLFMGCSSYPACRYTTGLR